VIRRYSNDCLLLQFITTSTKVAEEAIKVLCEQTREVNKLAKRFFGLCLILSGLGNIVVDFNF